MGQKIKKVRNGQLDFFKFVFAIVILLFHGRILGDAASVDKLLFENGAIAVEFFFIVSGFFFVPSVERFFSKNSELKKYNSVFKEDVGYIGSRIKGLIGLYVISVILSFAAYTMEYVHTNLDFSFTDYAFTMSKSIWNILLLQSSATTQLNINGATWYLSAMFIAMFVMYPIVRLKKDLFTRYICPVGAILFFGILASQKSLTGVYDWTPIHITRGLIRAFMGIMIGCIIYEFTNYLKKIDFTVFSKILFTLLGYGALFYSLVVMQFYTKVYIGKGYDWKVNFTIVFAFAVAVLVLAGGLDITHKLYNNRVSAFLGKFSTAIYLLHMPCRRIVMVYFYDGYTYHERLLIMLILSIAVSLISMFIVFIIKKNSEKLKSIFKKVFVK